MLTFSFLQCSEQRHLNSQPEGQGSLKQALIYDHNNKSHEKQVKERVSNMESELAFSQQHSAPCLGPQHVSFWLPPVHDWAQSTSAGARTPLTGNWLNDSPLTSSTLSRAVLGSETLPTQPPFLPLLCPQESDLPHSLKTPLLLLLPLPNNWEKTYTLLLFYGQKETPEEDWPLLWGIVMGHTRWREGRETIISMYLHIYASTHI